MHWLSHVLGMDTQQSPFYNFWSGVGTQFRLSNLFLPGIYYHHHNCHEPGCWRFGKHNVDGTPWCSRHQDKARRTYNGEVTD